VETRSRTALSPLRTVDTTIFWRAVACAVSAHLGFIARACSHGPVGRSQVGRVTPCAPILRSDAAGRGLPALPIPLRPTGGDSCKKKRPRDFRGRLQFYSENNFAVTASS
jgi:hypothetical protein